MTEISVKRSLLVELFNCSDENTWHITQRFQLIDDLPSFDYFNRTLVIRHVLKNFNFNEISDLFHGTCNRVQLLCFNVNTDTIFTHNVDFINSSHRSNRVMRDNKVQRDSG